MPCLGQPLAVLDLDVLFGGDGEEDGVPGQVRGGPGVHQAGGGAQEHRDLGVVAAGVGGPGQGVGGGVPGDGQGVELPQDGHGGALAPALQAGLDPGEGQALAVGQAEALEEAGDDGGGARLLEAQLGVVVDVVRDADELLPPAVDGGADLTLEGLQGLALCGCGGAVVLGAVAAVGEVMAGAIVAHTHGLPLGR